jgi:hypothetical protein
MTSYYANAQECDIHNPKVLKMNPTRKTLQERKL